MNKIKKYLLFIIIIFSLSIVLAFGLQKKEQREQSQPTPVASKAIQEKYEWKIEEVVINLEVPWDMALAPNGDIFITERPGRLKVLKKGKVETLASLTQVVSISESGLLGIALHPDFSQNSFIYLYYSYRQGGEILNRVSRFTYQETLTNEQIILDKLPGGSIHNGGRIRFGPDKKLWVLTGDGGNPQLSQNMKSLGGKVLRMDNDTPQIYSLGHRNPQGLGFHPVTGEPVVTEHGQSAYDEINLIKPKANYGWPNVKECYSEDPQYTSPILCSGEQTWAPSGAAFLGNSFFFAGLRGQLLERVEIKNGEVTSRETIIKGTYGRLRGVLADPKERVLYVSTSNRDGRGNPKAGDDKILKITILY